MRNLHRISHMQLKSNLSNSLKLLYTVPLSFIVLVHSHSSHEPCFQLQQADVLSEKALKTHCAKPVKQQTADTHSQQPAGEHSEALSC